MKRVAFSLFLLATPAISYSTPKPVPECSLHSDASATVLLSKDGTVISKRRKPETVRAFACTAQAALLVDSCSVIQYPINSFSFDGVLGEGVSFDSGIRIAGPIDSDSVWFVTGLGNVGIVYISPSGTPVHFFSKVAGSTHEFLDNDGPVTLSCDSSGCAKATVIGSK